MAIVSQRQVTEREVIAVGDIDKVANVGDWVLTFDDGSQDVKTAAEVEQPEEVPNAAEGVAQEEAAKEGDA